MRKKNETSKIFKKPTDKNVNEIKRQNESLSE